MAAMRALLLIGLLSTTASGQEVPPAPSTPVNQEPLDKDAKPSPAAARAKTRLLADLLLASKQLLVTQQAYRGTLKVQTQQDIEHLPKLDYEFHGANDDTLQWFAIDGWQIASRKQSVAVSHKDQPWSKPQGDSPEVPLSPRLLAPHLLTATLSLPEPAEHHGRPALRTYATWQGQPAKKLLFTTTVPSTQHEQVFEALASAKAKGREDLQLDATILYDPATREWLATTLRFACLDGKEISPQELPPKAPEGLPVLTSYPLIEATWYLERRDFDEAQRPRFDARARQLLQLDARGGAIDAPQSSNGSGKQTKANDPRQNGK